MAITVNGAILRNMPEQISKNVDDIADLQTTSENHETRIAALENDVVLAASFEDTTMTGTTSISDTLNVSASSTFSNGITTNSITSTAATVGSLTVSGNETVSGTLSVSGAATLTGGVSGNLAVSGNITTSGDAQIFEDITDASGNNRFVDGNITPETISGITYSYSKWSLSGTHLMIVLAGSIAASTVLSNSDVLAEVYVPSWFFNHLVGIQGSVVDWKQSPIYTSTRGEYSQTLETRIILDSGNSRIRLPMNTAITVSTAGTFRIQYDLLID